MSRIMWIQVTKIILFCLIPASAQLSLPLKDLLWRNDIKRMIENFGEENIVLSEKGETQRIEEARSFYETSGSRVQVFAGSNLISAREIAQKIQDLQLDSVYIVEDKNLFKVQLGNYKNIRDAEIMLDRLRYAGVQNAWIVDAIIHVLKSSMPATEQKLSEKSPEETLGVVFAIQLFVTNSSEKSQKIRNDFAYTLPQTIWIKKQGTLWKVLAGRFTTKEEAQRALNDIRASGFSDAWITQVDI